MFRASLVVVAAAFAALALAPSPAHAEAACALQFEVKFDADGRFSDEGTGRGVCAGDVAGAALDPGSANPSISGTGVCSPLLDAGQIALRPRRAFEFFSPQHLELTGTWSASAGVLSGTLVTETVAVAISGSLAVVPDGDVCRIDVRLLLGAERPAPRSQAAAEPQAEPAPAPAAAPAAKPKARKRKVCRRAKAKARTAKRCRRAKRRT